MFIASYFDRRNSLGEKKEHEIENQDCKKSNIERVLKNALNLSKEQNIVSYKRNEKERIKDILSALLKKKLKKTKKRNNNIDEPPEYNTNDHHQDNKLNSNNGVNMHVNFTSDNEIEVILRENKNLKHCSEKILQLSTHLKHNVLKNMNIQDVYKIIDTYISDIESEISKINETLELDAKQELRIYKDHLSKLCTIKTELSKNKFIDIETEGSSLNEIEHIINEMKVIQKLIKQKEYIICLKNTLSKLEYAKKCAVSRKYDETLHIILDVIKNLHIFKKYAKEQIIKGIQFFLPILTEYYMNRIQFLLTSISWGNNISNVSTSALEQLINDADISDDEYSSNNDQEEHFFFNTEYSFSEGKFTNVCTDADITTEQVGNSDGNGDGSCATRQGQNGDIPNVDKAKSIKEKIKNAIIFDNTYISLLKKESYEFIHILTSWNLTEKIHNYINEKNCRYNFSLRRNNCPIKFIDKMASYIITFFRSFFQNEKSPLFRFDKPEWGLKYLFYQCIISNTILKMFLNFVQTEDIKDSKVMQYILQNLLSSNEHSKVGDHHDIIQVSSNYNTRDGETKCKVQHKNYVDTTNKMSMSSSAEFSLIEEPNRKVRRQAVLDEENKFREKKHKFNKNNYSNESNIYDEKNISSVQEASYIGRTPTEDSQYNEGTKNLDEVYYMYRMMSTEQKECFFYEITNCEQVISKLNFKIVNECRLYILSRISVFIQLYHVEENQCEIKKAFLNFIHHVLKLYKKWALYDGENCKHLLDDLLKNTFVHLLLDVEKMSNEEENKECNTHDEDVQETNKQRAQKTSGQSVHELLKRRIDSSSEIKGVNVRNFFLLIEKEFLVDILKDMSINNCCIQLKNSIILEESDCVSEYVHILTKLVKKISKRILLFHHAEGGTITNADCNNYNENNIHHQRDTFVQEYINHVVKELLLIAKDEFRHHWNNINDLIGECSTACLLYVSFCSINKFLSIFHFKRYLKDTISSFKQLEKKMMNNLLDAFYHFISIRIYNLFTTNSIFHEHILSNLFKMKKCLPDYLFQNLCNKILQKLDSKILNFIVNQSTTYLHNECIFNTFINNSFMILQELEDLHIKRDGIVVYSMPILQEIIKLMTDDMDNLKKRIHEIKSNYALLLNDNNNNWLLQVTKIANALLREDDDDDDSSNDFTPHHPYEPRSYGSKACQFSLKKIKFLLLRRPDIKLIAEKSIIIREFIEE
ncbi:hypothetical protein, conserved [Plasmodium gonderi]|uniref:Uncharacterized protein n=1 Tax=Plasmodium gonderi TaxID=77519 RepID=A0A1Y1JKG3_PLAGO|nr:hypothetical protein, conserved [Plasmodium gonderi]GAW82128.1 hypothetical protein, conserved [Plasmodium gonderi]